jgi:hypothetical protein
MVAVFFHVSAEYQIWVWLRLAIWAFDRFVRAAYLSNSTWVFSIRRIAAWLLAELPSNL